MRGIFRRINRRIVCILLLFLTLSLIGLEKAGAASVTFRIIAINPSKTRTQTTQVKKYLPGEVKPKDVIDLGGLGLEYDAERSLYYVYKENLRLTPTEVRTFEIEVKDLWIVPEHKISDLRKQTDSILTHLEDTEYYTKAREIADTIYPRLDEIVISQSDEEVSRQQHIGIYRQNLITLRAIKEDIARLEKILVTAGGPLAPEMLADTKVKADAPSKTMTWIVIFSLVVFSGLLAAVLFFTWHRQARTTKDTLLAAKKSAFPESDSEGEDEEPNDN